MASLDSFGLDELGLSIEEMAALPADVTEQMLLAAGEVVKEYQQQEIEDQELWETRTLKKSIRVFLKQGSQRGRYVLVYPYGNHGAYQRKLKVKAYKRSKHGRTYTVGGDTKMFTNNDIGFLMEFGAPGRNIKAKQWMRTANEKAAEPALDAARQVYEDWLKSLNL